ncbi:hypothetical protein [Bradyrhizobium stylosanthis]|uniref:hypothetical protein n=1 Tax=Bradyrhizobium stylosanthis TaxID=1803665 RepID=UPI0012E8A0E3|nr:hypothetical protein [Bradyrhizobium stylosanthis]
MRLSVFGVKRGLHAPQLGNLPHDPLDQAVIEIGQLNNEFLEPLNLPVEDRATIAHQSAIALAEWLFLISTQVKHSKYGMKLMRVMPCVKNARDDSRFIFGD